MSKKNMIFKKNLVAHALVLAFGGGVLMVGLAPTAMAQSNAGGTVFGNVTAGKATTVTVKNLDTNATRSVQVDASGKFQITALPSGRYLATLLKDGVVLGKEELEVVAGAGSEANFPEANAIATVTVSGRRSKIDISTATNGSTFSSKELARLPIAQNLDAIIALAPNTTRRDPTYAGGASIGGGAATENSYYINGFPVTNPTSGLGASELPFGAIATSEILTGGYGAEFGRSVGGVVNTTGKSGTNNWEFGAKVSTAPSSLRAKPKNLVYPVIGASTTAATDGTLNLRREDNKTTQTVVAAYVGGPIIQDKVFMFVGVDQTETKNDFVNQGRTSTTLARNGYNRQTIKDQKYYGKLDWQVTDNHRLEANFFGQLPVTDNAFYSYDYATRAVGTTQTSGVHVEDGTNKAKIGFLRYVGNLTDDLTVTAVAGQSKSVHGYLPAGFVNIPATGSGTEARVPGLNYTSPQNFGALPFDGATDTVKSYRLDLEYKLGRHTIRGGIDKSTTESLNAGTNLAGGYSWTYGFTPTPAVAQDVPGGVIPALKQYGGLAEKGYFVTQNFTGTLSNTYAGVAAQYIEDRFQLTKDVLITGGIRNEQFYNANQDQKKFIEMKNQILPRLAAVWDVNSDASLKVYGSAGRYSVPIPSSIALRAANGSTGYNVYYTYTGTDANGQPTGIQAITGKVSANNELGVAKDTKSIAAKDMKAAYQDEISFGFDRAYSPSMNFGGKFTYRTLLSTIDDVCDHRMFDRWAAKNNVTDKTGVAGGCYMFNPGITNTFLLDFEGKGDYKTVTLTPEEMGGFPKVERKYTALDMYLEHPFRDNWYGKVNLTLQNSKGNTEGQTLSDLNTGQADVATTQTYDYAEQMAGANGLLPNNRTIQVKIFAYYQITPELTAGVITGFEKGRPRDCLGSHPTPGDSPNYGNATRYCFGATRSANVLTPRGTIGNYPWGKWFDLSFNYSPLAIKGISVRADLFNVFNFGTPTKFNSAYNSGVNRSATYGMATSFDAPRSAKLTVEYNKKF